MFRKTVQYYDIEDHEEIINETTVRFHFTLVSLRLYQERTGRHLFDDFSKVLTSFADSLKGIGAKSLDELKELPLDKQLDMFPFLMNPVVNKFLLNAISCLYCEIVDNKYVQNADTIFNIENSMYYMDLVNLDFFGELIQEITANQPKDHLKNSKKLKKNLML